MEMCSSFRARLLRGAAPVLLALVGGCGGDIRSGGGPTDDGFGPGVDLAPVRTDDGGGPPDLEPLKMNPCGDTDPSCTGTGLGPPQMPFPLSSDNNPNPN